MRLAELNLDYVIAVGRWRNDIAQSGILRTPGYHTDEEQEKFYREVVCNPVSPHRYYALEKGDIFVGMGGLTNISWENGTSEISLIVDPAHRGHGYGEQAVDRLLHHAFDHLRLHAVHGECYESSLSMPFWKRVVQRLDGFQTHIPHRKYCGGEFYGSMFFTFRRPKQ